MRGSVDGRAKLFASREELEKAIEEALAAGLEAAPDKDAEIKELEGKLAGRREKVDLILSSLSAENISLAETHLTKLRQEIAALEAELRAQRVANRMEDIVTRDLKALAREAADYLVDLRMVLDEGSVEEKKRFIRDFVAEILVHGDKREVRVGFYEDGDDGAPGVPLLAMARWGYHL